MKTNRYTVKLPSIESRSPEHELFARDLPVWREIARHHSRRRRGDARGLRHEL
jgi:hypothetical protein